MIFKFLSEWGDRGSFFDLCKDGLSENSPGIFLGSSSSCVVIALKEDQELVEVARITANKPVDNCSHQKYAALFAASGDYI